MTWAEWIANELTPSFGGVAIFCLDPDDLLEIPSVRELFHQRGIQLERWSGDPLELAEWKTIPDEKVVVVAVSPSLPTHLIAQGAPDGILLDISIAKLFRKLDAEIVRHVPPDKWQQIFRLMELERPMRTSEESAAAISRAAYGIDPLYAAVNGWQTAIKSVAQFEEALPIVIADELAGNEPTEIRAALTDVVSAKRMFPAVMAGSELASHGSTLEQQSAYGCTLSGEDLSDAFGDVTATPLEMLQLSLKYAEACSQGLTAESRRECNEGFLKWLRQNYDLALLSQNPSVLCLHTLVRSVIGDKPACKTLLLVVDAMGLESWFAIRRVWQQRGVFTSVSERAAFAIIPTLTSWSRRALFEGRLPNQFGPADHSPALERAKWSDSVQGGRYFSSIELEGIRDSLYQGKPTAIVDVSWDKRGHAIDPSTESIAEAAASWARRCAVAELIMEAVQLGYRCVITADHGQAASRGAGLPNLGAAIEERSKRCINLSSSAAVAACQHLGIADFKPMTLPKGNNLLFAKYGEAFDYKGAPSVSHGGLSIEEMIVPVIEIQA